MLQFSQSFWRIRPITHHHHNSEKKVSYFAVFLISIRHLALSKGLIEAFTKGQIWLVLSALNELFDLPSARAGRLVGLLLAVRARLLAVDLVRLLLLRLLLLVSVSTEHACEGVAGDVSDSWTDCHTSGCCCHLKWSEQDRLRPGSRTVQEWSTGFTVILINNLGPLHPTVNVRTKLV